MARISSSGSVTGRTPSPGGADVAEGSQVEADSCVSYDVKHDR
jgi:hypothetical protein